MVSFLFSKEMGLNAETAEWKSSSLDFTGNKSECKMGQGEGLQYCTPCRGSQSQREEEPRCEEVGPRPPSSPSSLPPCSRISLMFGIGKSGDKSGWWLIRSVSVRMYSSFSVDFLFLPEVLRVVFGMF